MAAIIEFPTVVQDLLAQYGDLFVNNPERRHFAEYLGSPSLLMMQCESCIQHALPQ
jgi:hypothetical protein